MREIISTISSKGQVTIPAEVRKRLGIKLGDKLSFVIESDGEEGDGHILIKASRYPDVASLRGAAGSLDEPLPWDEVLAIAREDRVSEIADTR